MQFMPLNKNCRQSDISRLSTITQDDPFGPFGFQTRFNGLLTFLIRW